MLTAGQRRALGVQDTFNELRMAPWKDWRLVSRCSSTTARCHDADRAPRHRGRGGGHRFAPVPEAAALTTLATRVLAIGLLGSALIVVIAGGLYYTANLQHLHRYRRHQQQIE